ncbi:MULTISPECIES: hypothetical protein [Spirosoma]|uniref:Uncharacterized protein n=1 Tax=Spirosoma liriopis TaxID=2937440 RepID=A0ABT0HIR0_9BACT|nr:MULTISPECIES: hypothetical protein [Spirosoma]MCK8492044.1 hypothetical protein [Spirosoma liriopis]UHG91465.1 hypothetical protein LQ777_00870 [Spirosoma oryzicola]
MIRFVTYLMHLQLFRQTPDFLILLQLWRAPDLNRLEIRLGHVDKYKSSRACNHNAFVQVNYDG